MEIPEINNLQRIVVISTALTLLHIVFGSHGSVKESAAVLIAGALIAYAVRKVSLPIEWTKLKQIVLLIICVISSIAFGYGYYRANNECARLSMENERLENDLNQAKFRIRNLETQEIEKSIENFKKNFQ